MKVLRVGDLHSQALVEATSYVAWGRAGSSARACLSMASISKRQLPSDHR
jgi:hypothetical protein